MILSNRYRFIEKKTIKNCQSIKNKQKAYDKLVEMSRNNNYTATDILDYLHHRNDIN